jgi:hypothetical protein
MWRGNSKFRSGVCLALVGAVVGTAACGDDPSSITRRPNGKGGTGAAGAAGALAGIGGTPTTGGAAGTGVTGGSSGTAGTSGSGGSAGTAGDGGQGGEGGDGLGGEGGEAGTTGGMGGAGTGGMTGGAGAGGAGTGGAGAGGAGTGGGGAGAGGAGAGGAGAGGAGAGGAGAGGAGAGGAGAGGAGAGGAGMGGAGGMPPMAPNLYFTEYVEGTNVADAFEVFNGSGASVNLAGCEIRVHYQAAVGSTAVTLSGTLAANDVFVVCLGNISFACNSVVGALQDLSGDDSVELACPVGANMVTLDVIGQYGMNLDPGAEWGMGATGTQNATLRRNCAVTIGDRNATNAFMPSAEWTGRAVDNVSGLGGRLCPCTTANQSICP